MSLLPTMLFARELLLVQSAVEDNPATDIVVPSGVQAGDLLIFKNMCRARLGDAVTPSGFTVIINDSSTADNSVVGIFYKIAVGTESGTTLTGMPDDSDNAIELLHFRGSSPITAVSVVDLESASSSADPGPFTCSAGSGTPPIIVFLSYADGDGSGNMVPSMTPAEDGTVSAAAFSGVLYKLMANESQDVVNDATDAGNMNHLESFYLQLTMN